jgi:hypothetical protein
MVLYYVARSLQLAGMWLLLFAIIEAGSLGPSPMTFAYGIAVFVVGWGLLRWPGAPRS